MVRRKDVMKKEEGEGEGKQGESLVLTWAYTETRTTVKVSLPGLHSTPVSITLPYTPS